jgi:hypothetical protein
MDLTSLLFNVVALVASLAALLVSALLTVRQSNLMHGANQLPIVIELFREIRANHFLVREHQLWQDLPGEHDPELGFIGMPEPLRSHMYDVCTLYQSVAYLVIFDVLDADLAYKALYYRMRRTWTVVEPFVQGERRLRGGADTFLNSLERVISAMNDRSRTHLR